MTAGYAVKNPARRRRSKTQNLLLALLASMGCYTYYLPSFWLQRSARQKQNCTV
jgi:hypothetical protein